MSDDEVGRISIRVVPELKQFREKMEKELRKWGNTTLHIKAELDLKADGLRQKVDAAAKKAGGASVTVGTEVDGTAALAQMRREMVELRAIASRDIQVKVELDKSALVQLEQLVGGLGSGGSGSLGVTGTGIGLSALTKVPAAPVAVLAALGAAVVLLESALGIATTSLMALPGILATVAVPVAAIALGMDGFKRAAETAKPAMDDLKNTMSAVAETSFTPVFQRLVDDVFPRLKAALPGVTRGLAELAQGPLDALNGAAGGQLQTSIDRIGSFLGSLRPAAEQVTSAVSGLIDQFTQNLPAISGWINDISTQFNAWVQQVSSDGSLQAAFSNLGDVIDHLVKALGSIGKDALDFMKDPGSMQMVKDLIDGIAAGLHAAAEAAKTLSGFYNGIFHGGNGDLNGKPDLGSKGHGSGRVPTAGLDNSGVKAQVDDLNKSIVETGKNAYASKGHVDEFLGGAGQFGGVPAAVPQAQQQVASATKITPPDTSAAKAAIQDYETFATQSVDRVKAAMDGAGQLKLPAPDLSQFKSAFEGLAGFVSQALSGLAQSAGNSVRQIQDVFTAGGSVIVATVQSWPGAIAQALAPLGQAGATVAAQLVAGLVNGINAGIPSVTAAANNLALQAKSAAESALGIRSPSREFHQIGVYVGEGFSEGIDKVTPTLQGQMADLANSLIDTFRKNMSPDDVQAAVGGAFGSVQASGGSKKVDGFKSAGADAGKTAMGMPLDFLNATADAAMSDLGISGDGVIPTLLKTAASWGQQQVTNMVFHTSSVEDTMAIRDRETYKQAVGVGY